MIIPCPDKISEWKNHGLMLALLIANIFFFLLFFADEKAPTNFNKFLNEANLHISGKFYHQFLSQLPDEEKYKMPSWLFQLKSEDSNQMQILGAYALRDQRFFEFIDKNQISGDVVAIKHWKEEIREFSKKYQVQNNAKFGLSSLNQGTYSWITYQFSHGNFLHLISNMIFLILIGSAVESLIGGAGLILIYLTGGIAGGMVFLLMNTHGTVPMVGASASVSALLAFYCFFERRSRVRYYYFLSPFYRNHGFIYLPTLLIVPLYLISDFASLWSAPEGLATGVAYTAHIGGTILGTGVALMCRFVFKIKPLENQLVRETEVSDI